MLTPSPSATGDLSAPSPAPGRVRRWAHALAGLGENPPRTAAAFAVGVFLSFSPFLGLQILLGAAAAVAFRLHRVAVLAGLCANLPVIMVPYYVLTTTTGAALLGFSISHDFGDRLSSVMSLPVYRWTFWEAAADLIRPFLGSFLLGSVLGAAVLGAVAYVVMLRVLTSLRSPAA